MYIIQYIHSSGARARASFLVHHRATHRDKQAMTTLFTSCLHSFPLPVNFFSISSHQIVPYTDFLCTFMLLLNKAEYFNTITVHRRALNAPVAS